ncbi:MAG: D-alanyl-D-alanine carboxypeptidase, partial [Clostridia bacterium]|nr:D-alanyl-D-alanine carboxypeptidase [Clostridia bacterium]
MKKIVISTLLIFLCFIIGFSSSINFVYAETENYTAKALYLIDYNTGEVLFEKNPNEKMPVASIVKLMTILLTLENI